MFPALNLLVEASSAHPGNLRGQARFLSHRLRMLEDFELLKDVLTLLLVARHECLQRPDAESWSPAAAKSEALNRQARSLAPTFGK
jgi:hypothetical protein